MLNVANKMSVGTFMFLFFGLLCYFDYLYFAILKFGKKSWLKVPCMSSVRPLSSSVWFYLSCQIFHVLILSNFIFCFERCCRCKRNKKTLWIRNNHSVCICEDVLWFYISLKTFKLSLLSEMLQHFYPRLQQHVLLINAVSFYIVFICKFHQDQRNRWKWPLAQIKTVNSVF